MAPVKKKKKQKKAAAAAPAAAASSAEAKVAEEEAATPDASAAPEPGSTPAKRKAAEATNEAGEDDKAAAAGEAPAKPAGHTEDAFAASAVIFFTRDSEGAVAKVLVAVEERKVQASYIGLAQKGKIVQRMLLFPMGRREKKDKNDAVETAKREYIEETGNYGGLSKYLDFADFSGDVARADATNAELADLQKKNNKFWTGRRNMAVFFKPAGMVNLFCEVPADAASSARRLALGGVSLKEIEKAKTAAAKAEAERAAEAEKECEQEPGKKKRKKAHAEAPKGNPTYSVGKTDHLEPTWVDAEDLRSAVSSGERSPVLTVDGGECRLFPTAASVLRLPEVRQWLGLAAPAAADAAPADGAEPVAA